MRKTFTYHFEIVDDDQLEISGVAVAATGQVLSDGSLQAAR